MVEDGGLLTNSRINFQKYNENIDNINNINRNGNCILLINFFVKVVNLCEQLCPWI